MSVIYHRSLALFLLLFSPSFALARSQPPDNKLSLNIRLVPLQVVQERLESAPRQNAQREVVLRRMFRAASCAANDLSEQIVDRKQPPSVICTLRGQDAGPIVVAGHLDKVRRGDGIVDDWSGASMLPSLYQSLRIAPRKHTFLFIGFTEEEQGLVGSKYFVRHSSMAFLHRIRAMVNLECLGLNPPEVWEDHAAPVLLSRLEEVARSMGINVPGVNVERVGSDDAMSFRSYKVPTITIHSVTQDTLRVLHSPRDNLSAEKMNDYYETYRLMAKYLADLDSTLP